MESLLLKAVILLAAALLLLPLSQRLGLGSVLGYLAAGIAVGPLGLALIHDAEAVLHFAELGVVLMLFLVGLELEPAHLWAQRTRLLGLGGTQVIGSAALLALLFWAVGFAPRESTAIGLILALSSTAFVIQLLVESGQLGAPNGRAAFAILLFQDVAVIPVMLMLPLLAGSQQGGAEPQLLAGVLVLLAMVAAGRWLLNPWLGRLAKMRNRDVMTASALLLVLGSAGVMGHLGLSMGLGAFVAGVLLANSPYREQLETDIQPFKGLLLGLFFLAIGMTMDLRLLMQSPGTIVGYLVLLVAAKCLVLIVIARANAVPFGRGIKFGILLSQGGEFAFVLFTQARGLNLLDAEVIGQLNLVVALSMAMTPLLLALANRLIKQPTSAQQTPTNDAFPSDQPKVVIAGLGRFGQIAARILVGRKIPFVALDSNPDEINLLRRYGNDVFFGDVTRLDLLQNAGIEQASVLLLAIDNVDDSLAVVDLMRSHFPKVKIIARARDRFHAYELKARGVSLVVRETFESALHSARLTLMELGIPESTAIELVRNFREVDETLLDEQVKHRDDGEKLIEVNREGRAELASLLAEK